MMNTCLPRASGGNDNVHSTLRSPRGQRHCDPSTIFSCSPQATQAHVCPRKATMRSSPGSPTNRTMNEEIAVQTDVNLIVPEAGVKTW